MMRTSTFFTLIVLVPAICLMSGCGSKNNPAGIDNKAANEMAEAQAEEPETNEPDAGSKGKPLGVKSGIIEYSYSGDKTDKSTQYFDDYGVKSAVYAEIVQQGVSDIRTPTACNKTARGQRRPRSGPAQPRVRVCRMIQTLKGCYKRQVARRHELRHDPMKPKCKPNSRRDGTYRNCEPLE